MKYLTFDDDDNDQARIATDHRHTHIARGEIKDTTGV